MTEEQALEAGFKKLPHFTIQNALIYDLGRNRHLSLGCIGTPNEMLFISETSTEDPEEIIECIVLHNYDYDGFLTMDRLLYFQKLKSE